MIFTPMKIYYTTYSNFHNDPNPVLFIMHSDSQYTEGLNIRYLSMARKSAFYHMIRILKEVGSEEGKTFYYTGSMMYAIIKKYYPDFAEIAYRKYFSNFLSGKLVNDALAVSSPLTELYLRINSSMAESTSNIYERRAANDMAVRVTNQQLYDSRIEEMQEYENLRYTTSETPGLSKSVEPATDEEVEEQKKKDEGEGTTP